MTKKILIYKLHCIIFYFTMSIIQLERLRLHDTQFSVLDTYYGRMKRSTRHKKLHPFGMTIQHTKFITDNPLLKMSAEINTFQIDLLSIMTGSKRAVYRWVHCTENSPHSRLVRYSILTTSLGDNYLQAHNQFVIVNLKVM